MPSSSRTVQRNFHLPVEQADWLREHAFRTRRPQAEIVREALSDYQSRTEGDAAPLEDDRNRALVERFRRGDGIDLEILRDEGGAMWSHDA